MHSYFGLYPLILYASVVSLVPFADVFLLFFMRIFLLHTRSLVILRVTHLFLSPPTIRLDSHDAPVFVHKLLSTSHNVTNEYAPGFVSALKEAGWNMDRVKVEHVHARAAW